MQHIQHGFTLRKNNGVSFLTIPSFEKAGGLISAFSTRIGGVSKPPFDTLSFSRKRERSFENYIENIRRFGEAVGFDHKDAVDINYAHSACLYRAHRRDAGSGVLRDKVPVICDGLYSDTVNLPLITYHADCVPLLFYDPVRRAVAACHAGWKGVAAHMAKNAIDALENIGCRGKDIRAAVGPCISVKYFEVQSDVRDTFKIEFGNDTIENRDGKIFIDLPKACVLDLVNSGIEPKNITVSDLCTYERSDLFFSHRRDKGQTGSMAAVIELKE